MKYVNVILLKELTFLETILLKKKQSMDQSTTNML